MKHIIGYARVSTAGQSTKNQIKTLKEADCTEVFIDDAVSGSRNHLSPKYRDLMNRIKELREQGDEVVVRVTKLDRFSRSLQALLEGVEEIGKLGASFESLDGGLQYDPRNPYSTLMLHMLGALAQFERELIKSRMSDGLEAKKAKGMRIGPKPKLTQAAVKAIRAAYATGTTTDRKLATEWNVSRSTVARVLGLYGFTDEYITLDQWEAAKKQANR